jgi:hypothetical protein
MDFHIAEVVTDSLGRLTGNGWKAVKRTVTGQVMYAGTRRFLESLMASPCGQRPFGGWAGGSLWVLRKTVPDPFWELAA